MIWELFHQLTLCVECVIRYSNCVFFPNILHNRERASFDFKSMNLPLFWILFGGLLSLPAASPHVDPVHWQQWPTENPKRTEMPLENRKRLLFSMFIASETDPW